MPVTRPDAANARVTLPALAAQAERLVELGVHEMAGLTGSDIRDFATAADAQGSTGCLLAVHPDAVPASVIAPLMTHSGKPGFIVEDMQDVDRFVPLGSVAVPDPQRESRWRIWSPEDASSGAVPFHDAKWAFVGNRETSPTSIAVTLPISQCQPYGVATRTWRLSGAAADASTSWSAPRQVRRPT